MASSRPVILYLHGFGSSGASGTVQMLRKHLMDFEVVAPDIPIDPAEALPYLKGLCASLNPVLVMGQSMGGMYALQMKGTMRLCINPALNMSKMSHVLKMGKFTYSCKRADGVQSVFITHDIIEHYRSVEEHLFDDVSEEDELFCYGLFGSEDKVVNCYDLFASHFPESRYIKAGHTIDDHVLVREVIPVIRELLPSQEPKYY